MTTKRELAEQIAKVLDRPGDEATIAEYMRLPALDLAMQARELPGVVARLKAEGQWKAGKTAPVLPECDLCGEPQDGEMGEFWDQDKEESVVAHAQCGLDAGLPMA